MRTIKGPAIFLAQFAGDVALVAGWPVREWRAFLAPIRLLGLPFEAQGKQGAEKLNWRRRFPRLRSEQVQL